MSGREHDETRLAAPLVLGNRTGRTAAPLHTGVRRIVAVVPHHPQLVFGNRDRSKIVLLLTSTGLPEDVWLVQRLSVDGDPILGITTRDGLAFCCDHSLDEV